MATEAHWRAVDSALQQLGGDSRRLLHGRGGCFAGWEFLCLDYFAPVLLATLYGQLQPQLQIRLSRRLAAAARQYGLEAVVVQRRYRGGAACEIVYGQLPRNPVARRGELCFGIDLDGRQNTGFFLDMEPGRRWLQQRVAGKRVLNLFAYTCSFSVVAQAAGAEWVLNVDMSRAALERGRQNHRLNGLAPAAVSYLAVDIMKSWGRIGRRGPYDMALIDPPSYQPGSFVAGRDYGRVSRGIPQLLKPGGDILLCLNAPELGEDFLLRLLAVECPDCRVVERLAAHPDFPDRDPQRGLKLLHCRYEPA